MRTCNLCGEVKPETDFHRYSTGRRTLMRRCKPCHSRRSGELALARHGRDGLSARQSERNARRKPEDKLNNRLRSRYGMTLLDYMALLETQGHTCAICAVPLSDKPDGVRAYVDHDHDTGRVRGLLCNACNRSIGGLRDDAELLRRAADYIDSRGVPLAAEHPEWRAPYGFQNVPIGPKRAAA